MSLRVQGFLGGWTKPKGRGKSNNKWKINTKPGLNHSLALSETQKGPGPNWRQRISLWAQIFCYGTPTEEWSDWLLYRPFFLKSFKPPFSTLNQLWLHNLFPKSFDEQRKLNAHVYKEEKKQKATEEQFQLVVPKNGNQLSASIRKNQVHQLNLMGYLTW